MDEIPSFGAWLRRRRKALDLTQEALAHRVGYSVSAIRKLEADEYRPSREIAEHLADALGIAPAERATFVHFARVGLDAEATSVCFPAAAPPTPSAPPRAPAVVPPSTTHLTHPSNLPPQPTPFVGRDEELALIATHLHNPACRLVTVIGPGGSGKTRLALEAAGAWRPDFPDGVYFVPLAALSSGSLLASTIADTLAFPLYGGADESDQAHDRHCGYYLALLQHTSEDELAGRLQDVLPKIEEDLGNVRTAYRWAVAHDKLEEIGMSLGGLYHFYSMRSLFREGLDVFEHAVELLRSTSERAAPDAGRAAQRAAIIAYALTLQGWFYLFRGLFDQARDRAQESAAWLRSTNARPERAGNLLLQGFIAVMLGPYEQAKQSLWECIAITSETGQRLIRATALQGLGMACMALEDNAEARQRLRESLVIFQAIGIPWGTAMCLQFLGDVARAQAEYAEAKQRYQESLTVRTDWGDRWGMGIALGRLGSLARTIGAYEDAQQRYQESLAIFTTLSHRLGMAIALGTWAGSPSRRGRLPRPTICTRKASRSVARSVTNDRSGSH